jgi:hypothetical protein
MCGPPKILAGTDITAEYTISFSSFYLLAAENPLPPKNIEICTARATPLHNLSPRALSLGQSSRCPPRCTAAAVPRALPPSLATRPRLRAAAAYARLDPDAAARTRPGIVGCCRLVPGPPPHAAAALGCSPPTAGPRTAAAPVIGAEFCHFVCLNRLDKIFV